jgi:hypothetical protein
MEIVKLKGFFIEFDRENVKDFSFSGTQNPDETRLMSQSTRLRQS